MEKELKNNAISGVYPFHMPGHKRVSIAEINPYDIDITEIDGYDNLHHAEGIIKKAQDDAALLYGAKQSYFLVNGSTGGLLAAISAVTRRGDKIIVARNCHKAVYNAIYLRGLKPVYVYPIITSFGIQGQVSAEQIRELLEENPDVKAVVVTSPTYDGVVSDVAQMADISHASGVPLIVDEAHGAHFGFDDTFPQNAVKLGADIVIVSVHKTLPAFTQTAILHKSGELVDEERLRRFLGIYQTSSPSYVMMTGIEKCIQYVSENQESAFEKLNLRLAAFYKATKLKNLRLIRKEDFSQEEAFDFDESKILIFTDYAGITGKQLSDMLLREYEIQLEMTAPSYALALCSIMDTQDGFERLSKALMSIDKRCDGKVRLQRYDKCMYQKLESAMDICEAYDAECHEIDIVNAAGHVSGEFVNLYPPGIPLIVPGEIINKKLTEDIRFALDMSIEVNGLTENNRILIL